VSLLDFEYNFSKFYKSFSSIEFIMVDLNYEWDDFDSPMLPVSIFNYVGEKGFTWKNDAAKTLEISTTSAGRTLKRMRHARVLGEIPASRLKKEDLGLGTKHFVNLVNSGGIVYYLIDTRELRNFARYSGIKLNGQQLGRFDKYKP
jgi:hypothetical protein